MLYNYEIFTDSSANLPDKVIDQYNINIISLTFVIQNKEYISYVKGADNGLQKFYELLRTKESLSTSCINEEIFINSFEPVLKSGKDILYIGFSSALSGTYCSGESASVKLRKLYPKRKILCINTLGASLGEGLLVLYAARQRQEGKSIEELYAWQENNRLKMCHIFTVDDLFYLFRGGRVKKSNYLIGNLINLKPILHMDDFGRLIPIGKVIGRKKSLITLAEITFQNIVEPENQTLCITHGDCIEDVNFLISKIESKLKVKEWIVNYVDPVIGAHSGPGTISIFFLGSKR
ncbi:MAG: DegV family protein [Clostridia bacterium]